MSDHFVGVNRGVAEGLKISDIVTGAATGATDLEVRIADAAAWTSDEIIRALRAIERYYTTSVNDGGPTFPGQ